MNEKFLAIVNPAAGGGKAAKLAGTALAQLKAKGLTVDAIASTEPGHIAQLASEAYAQGYRRFLAVGGDGTAHEVVNGVFQHGPGGERVELGFLPMGTGNSFLRDYSENGKDASLEALVQGRKRRVDVLRLRHAGGVIYSFNLISVGFTADVGQGVACAQVIPSEATVLTGNTAVVLLVQLIWPPLRPNKAGE